LPKAAFAGTIPPASTANQTDRVDVQEQSGGTTARLGDRVKNMSLPERERERLKPRRVLYQEVTKVGRRAMGRSDR
jgi:hypothetical protein